MAAKKGFHSLQTGARISTAAGQLDREIDIEFPFPSNGSAQRNGISQREVKILLTRFPFPSNGSAHLNSLKAA